jgi:hypothetical protein
MKTKKSLKLNGTFYRMFSVSKKSCDFLLPCVGGVNFTKKLKKEIKIKQTFVLLQIRA